MSEAQKYRILIVDDEEPHREWYSEIFEDLDHEVETAEDGLTALGVLKKGFKPDCIVTDVNMPRMDGNEFCMRLKSDAALEEIPVVMITGNLQPEDEKKGYESGVSKYILKTRINDEETLINPVLACCRDYRDLLSIRERLHKTSNLLKDTTITERAEQWLLEMFFVNSPERNAEDWTEIIFRILKRKVDFDGAVLLHRTPDENNFYAEGSSLFPDVLEGFRKKGLGRHNKNPYIALVSETLSLVSIKWAEEDNKKELQVSLLEAFLEKINPFLKRSVN